MYVRSLDTDFFLNPELRTMRLFKGSTEFESWHYKGREMRGLLLSVIAILHVHSKQASERHTALNFMGPKPAFCLLTAT